MRIPLSLAAAALLAGCSTLWDVRDAWSWDPTAPQQRSRGVLAPEQVAAMTNRLAELQSQRNEIRSRISAEPTSGCVSGCTKNCTAWAADCCRWSAN